MKTLPANEQDALGTLIMDELEGNRRWDEAFSRSPAVLAQLAASAMAKYQAGKTQALDPETL